MTEQAWIAEAVIAGALEWFGLPYRTEIPAAPDTEYFSAHGVVCNPDAALFKFWRSLREKGVNLGPAISGELDGAPYGETGNVVQFFEVAPIVCKPSEDWACYLAQGSAYPDRWRMR
jgi:hypothetical protein